MIVVVTKLDLIGKIPRRVHISYLRLSLTFTYYPISISLAVLCPLQVSGTVVVCCCSLCFNKQASLPHRIEHAERATLCESYGFISNKPLYHMDLPYTASPLPALHLKSLLKIPKYTQEIRYVNYSLVSYLSNQFLALLSSARRTCVLALLCFSYSCGLGAVVPS